jgi:hypothetical protein
MTLQQRITALATTIGTIVKSLITNQGSLSALTTTAKNSLVSAINEVKGSTVVINDAAASGTTTYSSNKIELVADAAALAKFNQLVGGASTALDTLGEIEAKLGTEDTAITNLLASVGNRVRFDAPQTVALTAAQITQVGANIGIGEPDTDFVGVFNAALV